MQKRWAYIFALLLLMLVRVLVLNFEGPQWLEAQGFAKLAYWSGQLQASHDFNAYTNIWPFPLFLFCTVGFWVMEEDDSHLALQFALLPIFYTMFCMIIAVLFMGQHQPEEVLGYPMFLLPWGYLYVGLCGLLIAILGKIRLLK